MLRMLFKSTWVFACFYLATVSSGLAGTKVTFPKDFQWCVASAAHQIEGGNDKNDWWEWEQVEGRAQSGPACDHWNRVDTDIELIQQIKASTYRFSIEWARIEPEEGVLDEDAIIHYRNEVDAIQKAGITPIITLNHYTLPLWVKNKGGWAWVGIPEAFGKFTEIAYQKIAPNVEYWVTVNEPMNLILGGYVAGILPPGEKRDISGIIDPLRGILKVHAKAYHVLHDLSHQVGHTVFVGMALHLREMVPWNSWNPMDRYAANATRSTFNWTLPDAMTSGHFAMNLLFKLKVDEQIPDLANTQDFVGINYYGGDFIKFSVKNGVDVINWDKFTQPDRQAFSKGFYAMVKDVSVRYPGKPILITENGSTFDMGDGSAQNEYLTDHLFQLSRAMEEGAPVKAYCYWTLYDNYEWGCGTHCPFGIFETNFSTFVRTPRPLAELFRKISINNGFEH
ncbi:MAG: family 1 glycosylhydrolase [Bdellovibrionia bacterium]